MIKQEVAKEMLKNIMWDGMEFYIKNDGDYGVRQIGSFGENEENVVFKKDLSTTYWQDAEEVTEEYLIDFYLNDVEVDWEEE